MRSNGLQHKPIRDAELVIAGCVRNGADTLARAVQVLVRATAGFARVHFLVIESDSNDATVAELQRLQSQRENFAFLTQGALSSSHPLRADRIAVCRNRYLDELRNNPRYAQADYVMVADLDGINRDLTRAALESCWQTDRPWDVCTANQLEGYYDVWALRHADWCPVDVQRQYARLRPLLGRSQALVHAIHSRVVRLSPRSSWIEVDSAFGGLALYRRAALQVGRYVGMDADGEVCEHVSLHAAMRAQGLRIFINPALINARRPEHLASMRLPARLRRAIEGVGKSVRDRLLRR